MSSRFVYACVRVPIEITVEGQQITHNDLTRVSFEECDKLPDLGNNIDINSAFQEYLQKPTESESESENESESERESESEKNNNENEIMVLKSEIKQGPKPPLKNSTFKNRSK